MSNTTLILKSMIIDKRLNLLNQLIKYFSLKTLIKYFKIKSMRTKSGFFFFFFFFWRKSFHVLTLMNCKKARQYLAVDFVLIYSWMLLPFILF